MSQSNVVNKDNELLCTDDHCINDEDEHVLKCKKCDRFIHYRCTKLPAYQVQVFLKFKSVKFMCQTCITPSIELKELLPTRKAPVIASKEIERLKNEVKDYKEQIKNIKTRNQC